MNINNNSEENKTEIKKEPLWATLVLIIIVGAIIYLLLPLILAVIATCFIISIFIEIKLTSDMKYTGWAALIFIVAFFFSGAAGWDW